MAERPAERRLRPALLDRLTDLAPGARTESADRQATSLRELREGVLRDLGWLLGATNLEAVEDLGPYPHVAKSVLNYGLPDLAGATASSLDHASLERILRECILDFEPRILRHNLRVRLHAHAENAAHPNALTFEIDGELAANPVPLKVYLETELDLESGAVRVAERGNRAG